MSERLKQVALNLSLFAFDQGPTNNLELIKKEAEGRGHRVNALFKQKLPSTDAIIETKTDFLITGLSSFKNADELALGETASEAGIPWLIVADTHRAFAREAATGRVGHAILAIAATLEEEEAAIFGYRSIHYFGGPPAWQDFWAVKHLGLLHEQPTVYISGIKSVEITDEFLRVVGEGVRSVLGENWVLVFRPHPGEVETDVERAAIKERRETEIFRGVIQINPKGSDAELAISAEFPFFTSGGTSTVTAAMHRKWAAYYESPTVRARVKAQTGHETWWPADVGAVVRVANPAEIAEAIRASQNPLARTKLRARQYEAYPGVAAGGHRVEERILNFIENYEIANGRVRTEEAREG